MASSSKIQVKPFTAGSRPTIQSLVIERPTPAPNASNVPLPTTTIEPSSSAGPSGAGPSGIARARPSFGGGLGKPPVAPKKGKEAIPSAAPCPLPRVTQLDSQLREAEYLSYLENLPEAEIIGIEYSIYSLEDIRKISKVKIDKPTALGYNTLNDPRMGCVNGNGVCATCGRVGLSCPGHFGHIEFARPIINPSYLRQLISVLNVTCNCCGCAIFTKADLQSKNLLNVTGLSRLAKIEDAFKGKPCRQVQPDGNLGSDLRPCSQNPLYVSSSNKENGKVLYRDTKAAPDAQGKYPEKPKDIGEIIDILDSISPETAKLLGFENGAHPRNFIMEAMLVIPPRSRPPVQQDKDAVEHPLTNLYKTIIERNNEVAGLIATKNEDKIQEKLDELYQWVSIFIDNSERNKTSQHQIKTVQQEIQSKEGLMRKNLQAGRVNFSARTVASPDPSLEFGQIRIPRVWASRLTVPVRAAAFNLQYLQNLLKEGRVNYITSSQNDDALQVKKGIRFTVLPKHIEHYKIKIGDEVDRWLQEGDQVIANRQPSLHKQSMMANEVVFGDQLTVMSHLSMTTPFNLDYDGDENNIHVVQTVQAAAELKEIVNIKQCIMNAQNNAPSMALVNDGLVGAYLLTNDKLKKPKLDADGNELPEIDPTLFGDITSFYKATAQLPSLEERLKRYNVPRYSGRALFSSLLPSSFFYDNAGIKIVNGVLTQGTVTKGAIGTSHNSIIQVLYNEYGAQRAADFLTDAPRAINRWLASRGFTIGIEDCDIHIEKDKKKSVEVVEEELQKEIDEEIKKYELANRLLGADAVNLKDLRKKLEKEKKEKMKQKDDPEFIERELEKSRLQVKAFANRQEDPAEEERRQKEIIMIATGAQSRIGKRAISGVQPDNAIRVFIESGAKGKEINLAQIGGALGQQLSYSKRPEPTLTGGTRTLPYFPNDLELESRGFVTNSYLQGLNPAEQFFNFVAARQGLVDTALKTADSGSMHHKIVKLMEDVKVAYDGSVRNLRGNIDVILEFAYGNDGFEAGQLLKQNTPFGQVVSFINPKYTAGRINSKYDRLYKKFE